MLGIIFLLLMGIIALAYLLYQQQKKVHFLEETLSDLKEVQEIKIIKANLEGRDQERVRIAKDWHDGIGNSLSTLRLIVDTIQPKNQESHTETLSLLEHTQREFSAIIKDELINSFSDESAIKHTFEHWRHQFNLGGIALAYEVQSLLRYNECSIVLKAHFYRITQELLTNTIKHAKASKVKIVLKEESDALQLLVEDDGIGWSRNHQHSDGLRSVKDRMKILEGKIKIESKENKGTKITVLIPIR